jgi:hypothetical protein
MTHQNGDHQSMNGGDMNQHMSEPLMPGSVSPENQEIMGRLAAHQFVGVENGPVFALVGNADTPNLLERIQEFKGEKRATKPVGLIIPFDAVLGDSLIATDIFDVDAIVNPHLRELVRNPDLLTDRAGALIFVKAIADMAVKAAAGLSDAVIPAEHGSSVQLFSTEGSLAGSALSQAAAEHNIRVIMSSLNRTGTPEIVTIDEARQYVAEYNLDLPITHQFEAGDKPVRPLGSYSIIEIKPDHISVARPGGLEFELIRNLFSDYDVRLDPDHKPTLYPDNVLRRQDLPPEHRNLKNEDLRDVLLPYYNV